MLSNNRSWSIATEPVFGMLKDLRYNVPRVWKSEGFRTIDAKHAHELGDKYQDLDTPYFLPELDQPSTLGQYRYSGDTITIKSKYPNLYRMILTLRHELQHRQQSYDAEEASDIDTEFYHPLHSYKDTTLDNKFGNTGKLPPTDQGYDRVPWDRDPAEWDATAAELGYLLHLADSKTPTDAEFKDFYTHDGIFGLDDKWREDADATFRNARRQLRGILETAPHAWNEGIRLYKPAEAQEIIKAYKKLVDQAQEQGEVDISDERLKQLDVAAGYKQEENKLLQAAAGYKGTDNLEAQLLAEAATDGYTGNDAKVLVQRVLKRLAKTETGNKGKAFGKPHNPVKQTNRLAAMLKGMKY